MTLPVVACPIDGQTGPRTPTAPPSASALLPADIANDVSLYSSWGSTTLILAPKGWKCAVSYGSSGVFTRLVPGNTPGNAADLRSSETMAGPVIVLLDWSGGTSGRYAVAGVGAPLFPDLVPFAEQLEPTPTGMRVTLWPNEIVGQRTKDFVRYEDPPNVAGTGTNQTGLQVSGSRIVGFVRLIPTQYTPPPSTPDLLLFAVRLGDSNEALENAIEAFAEERTAP